MICRGIRVLVAEDDPISREFLEMILQQLGCLTCCVADGKDAVEKATTENYDLVLMDITMPVMDGIDATQAIRTAGLTALPIVALTASESGEDRDKCLAAGMDDFLSKPVDPVRLQDVLAERAPRTSTPAAPPEKPPRTDRQAVLSELGVTEDFYAVLLREFVRHTGPLIERLANAMTAGDAAQVTAIAHRVKGSAASLRLAEIQRLAGALEAQSRAGVARSELEDDAAALAASFYQFTVLIH